MKNKVLRNTVIICVALIILTAVLVYFYDKKSKETKTDVADLTEDEKIVFFPLKKGSKNDYVKQLQSKINSYISFNFFRLYTKPPYQRLAEDGIFGSKTLANVNYIFKKAEISEAEFKQFLGMSNEDISKLL